MKIIFQIFSFFLILIALITNSCTTINNSQNKQNDSLSLNIPPLVRFVRIYGENNERLPPILLIKSQNNRYNSSVGYDYLTLEFDISANVPPAIVVKYIHCDVSWNETQNAFIQNQITNRSTRIDWSSATFLDDYYSYRGKVRIPERINNFEFAGNYKAVVYLLGKEDQPLAEARFFVVKPMANARMQIYTDFYDIQYRVTNTGLILETLVSTNEPFFDDRMHSVVYYRKNRYYEPYVVTNNRSINDFSYLYNYRLNSIISGFSSYEKRFRLEGVPAENVYRILNMTNTAVFPRSNDVVRLPMSDIARNGNFWERDDDGVMITDFISSSNDDYVYVEFVFDPESFLTDKDVFISGSFNNWNPDRNWQMHYDQKSRLYKCRNWVRRARHNYLYGIGIYDAELNKFTKFSFDYYEGNTAYSGHTYYAFVYYRQIDYGGYDEIIATTSNGIFATR